MSRWRTSLAVLGRTGSVDTQARLTRPSLVVSAVPDFLAPSLQHMNGHACRHTASLARASFEHSAVDSSQQRSSASSSSSSPSTCSVDFTSYFDADYTETSSTFVKGKCSAGSFDDIEARLCAAADEAELANVAKAIYGSSKLQGERQRVVAQQADGLSSVIELNEHFIISLVRASRSIPCRSGKDNPSLVDQLVSKYLQRLYKSVSHRGFSDAFLGRLATKVSKASSADSTLSLLFDIVQDRCKHQDAMADQAEGASAAPCSRTIPQIILRLMRGFSLAGRSDQVRRCFDLLHHHSLPATVFHYQLQLIALFRERSSQLASKDQADTERESRQIQQSILHIKTRMETDNIMLDDTFLATIVFGLSAPLRNPLAPVSSVAMASSALEMVRSVFGQFAAKARDDAAGSMPRLLSALIGAEIDAIERNQTMSSEGRVKARERVLRLIEQLESKAVLSRSQIAGSRRGRPFTDSRLASVYLRLRLHAALDDVDRGMDQLHLLLSVEPIEASAAARKELVLKQRSAVLKLFSAVMQRRRGVKGQDAAFEVMNRAFATQWFERVWTGVALPSNLGAGQRAEAYDPDATVLRIWTRWIRAWSADHWAEGNRVGSNGTVRYRTFTGSYPWQTLKRGLGLLNEVLDQYEALDNSSTLTHNNARAFSPRIAFASLFTERNVLDKIVKMCLRGGRRCANETIATHVDRRLALLIHTLARVHVPARTWEHVESSMLRHLALIDRDALPTAAVQPAMQTIEERKRQALLRNKELLKAWEEAQTPETGSIFVLRQMLRQRELQKSRLATAAKPAFT